MLARIRSCFAPAPPIPRLPEAEVRRLYPRYRMQIMESTYLGYAMFYLVRNNLSVVSKDMAGALHYDSVMIGNLLAVTALSYGVGKFLMGALSDRSNPRVFMACGLLLTALCNFAFGAAHSYTVQLWLWGLNGFVQGMGWPPCGRSMGHWFSERERGLTFSIWNTAHNVGGGIAGWIAAHAAFWLGGWEYAFYVPGAMAAVGSVYIFARLRDTPQSLGLPPIEEYQDDHVHGGKDAAEAERNLSFRELLFGNALSNKYIWLLATANFFAYITRYSMLDWGPMYLREMKGATLIGGGWAVTAIEFGGIPATIFLGWISDRIGGRRGMVATFALFPILAAFTAMLYTPPGWLWFDMTMLFIVGLFIYPVINLITIIALDLSSKKAIGTAAGFIGLFGYIGRTVQNAGFGWMLAHYKGIYGDAGAWNMVIVAILVATGIAVLLLALTWRFKPRV